MVPKGSIMALAPLIYLRVPIAHCVGLLDQVKLYGRYESLIERNRNKNENIKASMSKQETGCPRFLKFIISFAKFHSIMSQKRE